MKAGKIDGLASDHSPCPPDMKELESGNFMKAWGGIAGPSLLCACHFYYKAAFTLLRRVLRTCPMQACAMTYHGRNGNGVQSCMQVSLQPVQQ